MIKLKSLLLENTRPVWTQADVNATAKAKGYIHETYRGDVYMNNIYSYSSKERREYGIFTTPIKDVAKIYTGRAFKYEPRRFYVNASKILDLTEDSMFNYKWVEKWASSFDDWTDRTSGEPMSAWDILQGGKLFDYEGDWSGERWTDIQASADNDNYDAIVLPDYDGSYGIFPSFVIFNKNNLKLADLYTYDNNKQLIPLKLRFNINSDDIRY